MRLKLLHILFIGVLFSSCVKEKVLDKVPAIDYVSFYAKDENTAYLTISYEDGDGDIFEEKGSKKYNFFAIFYYKDGNGNFIQDLDNPIVSVIERPSELSKDQPIKGEIMKTLTGWRSNVAYKNFRYEIYMTDQAGNKSNVLTTPEIITPF